MSKINYQFKNKSAAWNSIDSERNGIEYTWLQDFSTTGTILRMDEDLKPFQVSYFYEWDENFQINKASFVIINHAGKNALQIYRENGKWISSQGEMKGYESCLDVDLWPSPLTNTFAIRRLNLELKEKCEIDVLWFSAPEMRHRLMKQSYTRLDKNLYLFENSSSNFKAEILVDDDDLVVNYPGLFERENSL